MAVVAEPRLSRTRIWAVSWSGGAEGPASGAMAITAFDPGRTLRRRAAYRAANRSSLRTKFKRYCCLVAAMIAGTMSSPSAGKDRLGFLDCAMDMSRASRSLQGISYSSRILCLGTIENSPR